MRERLSLVLLLLFVVLVSSSFTNFEAHIKSLGVETTSDPRDRANILRAAELAVRAIGKTSPNPCVGCVIVDDEGNVVGEGWHERSGGPHAEVVALRHAGERARGCTAYVTLEPCNHYGKTPPCTLALINQGVKKVVAGMVDPDPRVSGKGLRFLQSNGVEVTLIEGVEQRICQEVNAPFIYRVLHHKPFLTRLTGWQTVCTRLAQVAADEERLQCISSLAEFYRPSLVDMDCVLIEQSVVEALGLAGWRCLLGLLPSHCRYLFSNCGNGLIEENEVLRAAVTEALQAGRRVFLSQRPPSTKLSGESFENLLGYLVPSGLDQNEVIGEVSWDSTSRLLLQKKDSPALCCNGLVHLCPALPPSELEPSYCADSRGANDEDVPVESVTMQRLVSLGFGDDAEPISENESLPGHDDFSSASAFLSSLVKKVETNSLKIGSLPVTWTVLTMRLWNRHGAEGQQK